MKANNLFLFLIIAVGFSCKKYNEFDGNSVTGTGYIRGRIFVTDTFTANLIGQPLGEATVYCRSASEVNTFNYLVSAKANADGYFIIKNLNPDSSYRIFSSFKNAKGATFSVDTLINQNPNDAVSLNLKLDSSKGSGFHFSFIESTLGSRISGGELCFFTNRALWGTNMCTGKAFSIAIDSLGRAYNFNVPNGEYYYLATLAVGSRNFMASEEISIKNGILIKRIPMIEQFKAITKLNLVTMDGNGQKLAGVKLCFFTSQQLSELNECDGRNFELLSNSTGDASIDNISTDLYFVNATLKIGNVDIRAKYSFKLEAGKEKTDTIFLR